MIPAIGIIIGSYVLTRMVEIIAQPDAHTATKAFAIMTALVAVFCTAMIILIDVSGALMDRVR